MAAALILFRNHRDCVFAAALGVFLLSGASSIAAAQTAAAPAQQDISGELEHLAADLRATRAQMEQSREKISAMQAEIDRLRTQLAARDAAPAPAAGPTPPQGASAVSAADDAGRRSEEIGILQSTIEQQQQTKVESSAQSTGSVRLQLTLKTASGARISPTPDAPAVVWLTPLDADGRAIEESRPGAGRTFQMVQEDKMFHPHLLVVPTGSVVAFPNHDPFFHNVFSLFNGRRFDLGLYQRGESHSVPFNREGVSYLFCNIHPQMGAVIVSVATPYYVTAEERNTEIRDVPPGSYVLRVWAEDAEPQELKALSRRIRIGPADYSGGTIDIPLGPHRGHLNKFGQTYTEPDSSSPY